MHRPACHDTVEGEHQEAGEHSEDSHQEPGRAGCHLAVGLDGVGTGMTAHHKLTEHDGQGQAEDKEEVYEDEGCPTIASCLRGEAPYIAQPHGTACRSQYDPYLTCEMPSFFHIFFHFACKITILFVLLQRIYNLRTLYDNKFSQNISFQPAHHAGHHPSVRPSLP